MTVEELIERLQEMDPDAQVLIVSQPSWPFENSIAGVSSRSELLDYECAGGEDEDVPQGANASDVFLVEGRQLRYGHKNVWNLV